MPSAYSHSAVRRAKYEILAGGTYYGEVTGFVGLRMGRALPVEEWGRL